ncbi:hypothetical protein D3C77_314990 [compost metagenome]
MVTPTLRVAQIAGHHVVRRVGVKIHAAYVTAKGLVTLAQGLADKATGTGDEHGAGDRGHLPLSTVGEIGWVHR